MQLNHFQLQQCKIQAKTFALLYGQGYDPKEFVPAFMNSKVSVGLDSLFHRFQWAGEEYLSEELVEEQGLVKSKRAGEESAEAVFWIGYLYRYWHFVTGETSKDIYFQAPVNILLDVYPGFHALDTEIAVEELKSIACRAV
ncbi:MAG: hypothetical protein MJ249_03880 [Kiritimatiellae bacterium]|nr:hypothetical protein [Kiritimatiellia bacterium]